MENDLLSLLIIVAAAFICPAISALIPKKLVPETVFLLIAGMVIGPNVLGIAVSDNAITLLSDLGLGFLFLLAGYEIDPKELAGRQGRYGFFTWLITFVIAVGAVALLSSADENPISWFSIAIALTTTAFGTLVPILHERGLVGTPIGNAVFAYGTWGEIGPVIAIALVLSVRTTWMTLLVLGIFAAIAVVAAMIPKRLWEKEAHLARFITANADTNAQMRVRSVMVLLILLLAVTAFFDLDIVMGAFAAGFILRFLIPEGDERLERKLNGMGYGFFIPLFFVVSGMAIDPAAVMEQPLVLLAFLISLLLIRALPVLISLRLNPDTRSWSFHRRATVAFYCTTALPLIVAVTTIAVNAGAMTSSMASLLVAAAGISVFIMPFLASVTLHFATTDEKADGKLARKE